MPVPPLPAASLVAYRIQNDSLAFLMGQRSHHHRFMPGYLVFPGGKVDPVDNTNKELSDPYLTAALRECYEETGYRALKPFPTRKIARAITPETSPIRFDTLFFLCDGTDLVYSDAPTGELTNIAWYQVQEIEREHRLADVTAAILRESVNVVNSRSTSQTIAFFEYRAGGAMTTSRIPTQTD